MTLSKLIDNHNAFSGHLAHPDGFYGQVISRYADMTFEAVNQWTINLMALQPDDNVLEIGFGSGRAIQAMAAVPGIGSVVGIDNSALMVQQAATLNEQAIRNGTVRLLEADVCRLPDFGQKFDKIAAMNTSMYWPADQMESILAGLRSRLKPGGVLFISFQRLFERYERGEQTPEIMGYAKAMQKAGYVSVDGTVQTIADKQAAIAEGRFICIAVHGVNPAFALS